MSQNSPTPLRRALLIVNPAARRVAAARVQATRAFEAAGVRCDVRVTDAAGHAATIARDLGPQYDAVFTLGGDGTASEVIGALADGGGPPVGVLPGGTGNVLARSLRIPLRISRAVAALVRGRETRLDLGRLADGRHFVIGLGIGIDEAMIAGASAALKQHAGFLAYFWSGIRAGVRMEQFGYRLTVDGSIHEGRAASVLIANLGSVLGNLVTLGPAIRADDGVLHACIFAPRGLPDAIRVFARMLRGTVGVDPCVSYVSGRAFRLETTPPKGAQVDGELIGRTPLEVTVRPGAARLLIP